MHASQIRRIARSENLGIVFCIGLLLFFSLWKDILFCYWTLIVQHSSSTAFFNNRYSWCRNFGPGNHEHCSMNTSSMVWLCFSMLTQQPIKQNMSLCRLCGTCQIQHREHDRVGTHNYYFHIILQLENIWQMMVQAVTRQMQIGSVWYIWLPRSCLSIFSLFPAKMTREKWRHPEAIISLGRKIEQGFLKHTCKRKNKLNSTILEKN